MVEEVSLHGRFCGTRMTWVTWLTSYVVKVTHLSGLSVIGIKLERSKPSSKLLSRRNRATGLASNQASPIILICTCNLTNLTACVRGSLGSEKSD